MEIIDFAGCGCIFIVCWSWSIERFGLWNCNDIRARVHSIRNRSWSQKGWFGNNCTNCHWFYCWSKYLGGWGIHRSIHEPGCVIWASFGELDMGQPLGILGWAFGWWWHCWACLWIPLHQPNPWTFAHKCLKFIKTNSSKLRMYFSKFDFFRWISFVCLWSVDIGVWITRFVPDVVKINGFVFIIWCFYLFVLFTVSVYERLFQYIYIPIALSSTETHILLYFQDFGYYKYNNIRINIDKKVLFKIRNCS